MVLLLVLSVVPILSAGELIGQTTGSPIDARSPSLATFAGTDPAHGAPIGSVAPGVPISWSVAGSNEEVQEAVDPVTHSIYATWMAGGWIWFARSNDLGASFGQAQIVAGSQSFSNDTVFAQSWNPAIATSGNGTVYVAFVNANTSVNNLGAPVVAASYDHGRTFAFSAQVYSPGPAGASDRPFVAAGPNGTVYLTWDDAPRLGPVQFLCSGNDSCSFAAGDLNAVFSRSVDGGHTWGPIVSLSPGFPHGGAWTAPILVEPSGRIDVLYGAYHTARGTFTLKDGREFFTTSTDGGSTWSSPVLVGNPAFTNLNTTWWIDGSLAVGTGGTLFATFDTQEHGSDVAWITYSTDHGARWSTPLRVDSSSSRSPHIIQVIAGPSDEAYVAWLTNASSRGWETYVSVFSVHCGHAGLGARLAISDRYGAPRSWPGDTLGLVYLGDQHLSVGWGIEPPTGSAPKENVVNFVVSFEP